MITIETRPVRFGELSQKAKQHARENWQELDDWWTHTCGDAASVGIEIKSFDIERGEIDGGLLRHTHADDSAKLILANHGKTCDTYQTALKFMASYVLVDHNEDDEDWGELSVGFNLCERFKKDILKEYLAMLKIELEYLESDKAIEESGALFNEDGEFETWG